MDQRQLELGLHSLGVGVECLSAIDHDKKLLNTRRSSNQCSDTGNKIPSGTEMPTSVKGKNRITTHETTIPVRSVLAIQGQVSRDPTARAYLGSVLDDLSESDSSDDSTWGHGPRNKDVAAVLNSSATAQSVIDPGLVDEIEGVEYERLREEDPDNDDEGHAGDAAAGMANPISAA